MKKNKHLKFVQDTLSFHKKFLVHKKREYKRRSKPGAAPGTLIAHEGMAPTEISLIGYAPDNVMEKSGVNVADIRENLGQYPVLWVNVNGLANIEQLQEIAEIFNIHRLALEDVVNVNQRPKTEEYEHHLFVVTRMVTLKPDAHESFDLEQISLFFGKNFVLSFQEEPGDCLDPVRARIRQGKGRMRQAGPDYLTYAILDTIVDGYFPVFEHFSDEMDEYEEQVFDNPQRSLMEKIHGGRRELLLLRRAIWPQREMISNLTHHDHVDAANQVYFRDCHDHVIQLIDILETLRERLSGLTDLYLSSVSNRMNEVMKVLTMIATIFMPLGFVAGLYGMNFNTESRWNMPELGWDFGYFYALGVMAVLVVLFLAYFKKKGWLG